MRTTQVLTVLFAATLATTARAQDVSVATAPGSSAVAGDPNLDRGFLLPTAMTQPAGSVTYSNYELLLHGLSYGLTDGLQLSATVLSPIVRGMPFVGTVSLKGQIYRGNRVHLSLQGSAGAGSATDGDEHVGAFMAGVGGLASVCLRRDCSTLLSASVTYQLLSDSFNSRNAGLVYGASIVHRLSPRIKLLAEVASASSFSSGNLKGAVVNYGVRFHGDDIACDVGFIKPISGQGEDPFLLGFPFVSVSYRWP